MEPSTPSKSMKSAFVFFFFFFKFYIKFYLLLFGFMLSSGKKCAIVVAESDNEDVSVPKYALRIFNFSESIFKLTLTQCRL